MMIMEKDKETNKEINQSEQSHPSQKSAVQTMVGFKQTEIGLIPEDWEVKTLGEIAHTYSGGTPNTTNQNYYGGSINFITSGDLNKGRIKEVTGRITKLGLENSSAKIVSKNTFLIAMYGATAGVSAITEIEAAINQAVLAVIPLDTNHEYLFFWWQINKEKLVVTLTQGGQPNLNSDLIKSVPIPLPPKPEQEAIAKVLSDTDTLIEKLEQLIAKKRLIKQGAMQQLLKPQKGWEVKKLGEVVDIIMGQSPDSKNYNSNQLGLPLLQGNADLENRKQFIRFWTSHITKTCDAGDLILTVRAPVGSIGVAIQKSCIGRGVCSLKPKSVSKDFIYHLLIFKEQDWKILEQGSTFTSANSNQIYGFEISIPKSEPEQTRIAQILTDMDSEIEALERQLAKYKLLKQGMMQVLLTGKIRLNH